MEKNMCLVSYNNPSLSLVRDILGKKFPCSGFEIVTVQDFRQNVRTFIKKYFHFFERAVFLTYDLETLKKPLLRALILFWFTRKEAYFLDIKGNMKKVDYATLLFGYVGPTFLEIMYIPFLLLKIRHNLRYYENSRNLKLSRHSLQKQDKVNGKVRAGHLKIAYLRTDHVFNTTSGGSVGHIKGVADGFLKQGYSLFFLSTDKLALIDEAKTPIHLIKPHGRMRSFNELIELEYNQWMKIKGKEVFLRERPAFIYQRYSLHNYAGIDLAERFNLPFILEYNGSFPWMARNWGKPLRFERIAERIELINLHGADLIVVVSKPMRDELMERGIPEEKILVNPNGVDPDRFNPSIDGSSIRKQYGLEGKIVVGFIGTFGRWHGAEVLARAVLPVLETTNQDVHFLFIGDGPMMPEVKRIVKEYKVSDFVTFTGAVPQEKGPEYLAACDIFASPHVPNPDGTPFFGSPTKLFEYMAMGRGIVASDLDQIGEVLEHGQTSWLVRPGDAEDLAGGIKRLIEEPELRDRLGRSAREEAVSKYTWEAHTGRILQRITQKLTEEDGRLKISLL